MILSSMLSCPDCAVGRAAREQVFGPELPANLLIALLPFAIIVAICVHVERGS